MHVWELTDIGEAAEIEGIAGLCKVLSPTGELAKGDDEFLPTYTGAAFVVSVSSGVYRLVRFQQGGSNYSINATYVQ